MLEKMLSTARTCVSCNNNANYWYCRIFSLFIECATSYGGTQNARFTGPHVGQQSRTLSCDQTRWPRPRLQGSHHLIMQRRQIYYQLSDQWIYCWHMNQLCNCVQLIRKQWNRTNGTSSNTFHLYHTSQFADDAKFSKKVSLQKSWAKLIQLKYNMHMHRSHKSFVHSDCIIPSLSNVWWIQAEHMAIRQFVKLSICKQINPGAILTTETTICLDFAMIVSITIELPRAQNA